MKGRKREKDKFSSHIIKKEACGVIGAQRQPMIPILSSQVAIRLAFASYDNIGYKFIYNSCILFVRIECNFKKVFSLRWILMVIVYLESFNA